MTQEEKVLAYMEEHGGISLWEAFGALNVTRLAAVIYRLRKVYEIETVNCSRTKDGEVVRWAEYRLKEPLPVCKTEKRQEGEEWNLPSENNTSNI